MLILNENVCSSLKILIHQENDWGGNIYIFSSFSGLKFHLFWFIDLLETTGTLLAAKLRFRRVLKMTTRSEDNAARIHDSSLAN